jgi:hypothetical protein
MCSLDNHERISPENSQQIYSKPRYVIREYREKSPVRRKSPTPINYHFLQPFTDEDV